MHIQAKQRDRGGERMRECVLVAVLCTAEKQSRIKKHIKKKTGNSLFSTLYYIN